MYFEIVYVIFASILGYIILKLLLKHFLKKYLVEHFLKKLEFYLILILVLVVLHIFYFIFEFPQIIIKITHTLETFIIALILYKIINIFLEQIKYEKIKNKEEYKTFIETALFVIFNSLKILILFGTFLYVLLIWNINITPILASAGIAGIVIGFALKDVLENIFSGVILLLDPPFKIGDIVKISDRFGEVIEIGIRNTKIKLFDNTIISIPNSQIINSELINYSMPNNIVRITLTIGVSYDTDPEKVKKVVLESLKEIPEVLNEPEPKIFFREYGDFALIFEIWYWTNIENMFTSKDKVNSLLWKKLKENGIEIPYPIRTIYIKNNKDKI